MRSVSFREFREFDVRPAPGEILHGTADHRIVRRMVRRIVRKGLYFARIMLVVIRTGSKESRIEDGQLMLDHLHAMIPIPPKYAVPQVVEFTIGKAQSASQGATPK